MDQASSVATLRIVIHPDPTTARPLTGARQGRLSPCSCNQLRRAAPPAAPINPISVPPAGVTPFSNLGQ